MKQSVPYKQAKSCPSRSSTIAQFQNQTVPIEKQRQNLTIDTYMLDYKKHFPNKSKFLKEFLSSLPNLFYSHQPNTKGHGLVHTCSS